jgi:exonuclease VII small subunit
MMSDLIKRLRAFANGETGTEHCLNDLDEAADRIEKLEAQLAEILTLIQQAEMEINDE